MLPLSLDTLSDPTDTRTAAEDSDIPASFSRQHKRCISLYFHSDTESVFKSANLSLRVEGGEGGGREYEQPPLKIEALLGSSVLFPSL